MEANTLTSHLLAPHRSVLQTPSSLFLERPAMRRHGDAGSLPVGWCKQVLFSLRYMEIKIWPSTTLLFHTFHFISGWNQSLLCSSEGLAYRALTIWSEAPISVAHKMLSCQSSDSPATSTRDGSSQAGRPSFLKRNGRGLGQPVCAPGSLCRVPAAPLVWAAWLLHTVVKTPLPQHQTRRQGPQRRSLLKGGRQSMGRKACHQNRKKLAACKLFFVFCNTKLTHLRDLNLT